MTGQLLEFLTIYGLPAAALLLAIGQFGVPIPTSLALLTLGALSASDDTDVTTAFIWALAGASLGDQAGFFTGRLAGQSAESRPGLIGGLARKARAAEPRLARWGGSGVFFSRWLVTPLGPAINIASGITGLSWTRFTLWGVAGEALWVSIYIALGFSFGSNIETLAGILGNLTMALAMLALAALLGWRLKLAVQTAQARTRQNRNPHL
ncbi:DedA family protein [Hoeflea sp. YIM 152468]|uniref:DedA family protein n=1 Tax=Hoeflea sp. YIM 152468 TaxID=3031759 RepID=UPI0023DB8657|nr:DedA family protein [Hoeflea sp. YIM 152468]MDF1607446.1 DedA family protein [Hoeflea sp. YIM 152468]